MAANDRFFSGDTRGITLTSGKMKSKPTEQMVRELPPGEQDEWHENQRYVAAGVAANKLPLCVALDGEKPCTGTAVRGKDKCKEHNDGTE